MEIARKLQNLWLSLYLLRTNFLILRLPNSLFVIIFKMGITQNIW